MNKPGENLPEEPQQERGAPGSRDTGSDQPSGGPADRPSGTYEGDESVPAHSEHGKPEAAASDMTPRPPSDVKPAVPPYEGRKTSAEPEDAHDKGGARTAGATGPKVDADYKAPPPGQTAGGATASPADEQPASSTSETDRDDDAVGPAHVAGTGRAENKR